MVRIDGSQIDPTPYHAQGLPVDGLTIEAVELPVSGLSITGFSGAGIDLEPGPNYDVGAIGSTIQGNFIGVDSFNPNSKDPSTWVDPATNFDTNHHLEANGEGIIVRSSNNRIGGTLPVSRNVIQGNTGDGVLLQTVPGASDLGTGNRVEGDYILDNGDGRRPGRDLEQLHRRGDRPGPGRRRQHHLGQRHLRRPGRRPPGAGQRSATGPAQGNVIVNNEIGTNVGIAGLTPQVRGMSARPNALDGILIQDSPGNIVGGLLADSKNVIAGNGRDGVSIQDVQTQDADDNTVQGNWIGFNTRNGTTVSMPNRDGVNISSADNTIGGTDSAAQNVIIENARNGVTISGMLLDINNNDVSPIANAQPTGNVVEGNYIGTQAGADYLRQHPGGRPHRRRHRQHHRRDHQGRGQRHLGQQQRRRDPRRPARRATSSRATSSARWPTA